MDETNDETTVPPQLAKCPVELGGVPAVPLPYRGTAARGSIYGF